MFTIKKLNSRGVIHHMALMLVIVMAIAGFGAYQVSKSSADSVNPYTAKNAFNCHPGKEKVTPTSNCTLFKNDKGVIQANKIEAECATFHLQYKVLAGNANAQCAENCISGWHVDVNGGCVPVAEDSKLPECQGKHQTYDRPSNSCTGICVDGYAKSGGDCVKTTSANSGSGTTSTGDTTATDKQKCAEGHRVWNATENKCSAQCLEGYTKTDGKLPCIQKNNGSSTIEATNPTCSSNATRCAADTKGGLEDKADNSCVDGKVLNAAGRCVVPANPPVDPGLDTKPDDPLEVTADSFKIVVYKNKDFSGDVLTITEDQPTLPSGWNDKISSYKILKGRWQICEDTNYQTNCRNQWASDPDLKAKNDKISSLKRVTNSAVVEAPADVKAQCLNAEGKPVAADANHVCPAATTLTCPEGYTIDGSQCMEEIQTGDVVVPVDARFAGKDGQAKCEVLGREWIGKIDGKVINNGQYGCSLVTCDRQEDGAPKQFPAGPVCMSYKYAKAYAQDLGETKCKALHRVWVNQVSRCAQMPNQKDKNQTLVKAPQCTGEYTTYYIYKAADQEDECFKPGFFQQVKGVANSTGGALGSGLQLGPKAFCNTVKGGNYHWTGKRCVIDRKKCWDGSTVAVNKACPADTRSDCEKYGTNCAVADVPASCNDADYKASHAEECTPPTTDTHFDTNCAGFLNRVPDATAKGYACPSLKKLGGVLRLSCPSSSPQNIGRIQAYEYITSTGNSIFISTSDDVCYKSGSASI